MTAPGTKGATGNASTYNELTEAATFLPKRGPYQVPCIEVAGVQVYAYVDRAGVFRVSVDLDTADSVIQTAGETVPMVVTVQGETVFTGW